MTNDSVQARTGSGLDSQSFSWRDTPVVILAGGFGTRLGEVSANIPKPLVEVNGLPLLIHLMDSYSRFGFNRFVILGGHKVREIRRLFKDFDLLYSDFEADFSKPADVRFTVLGGSTRRDWIVTVLDTGLETMTGGRLLRAQPYLQDFDRFFFTYGDGLSDINFPEELRFHLSHRKIATVAAVRPRSKFGHLATEGDKVIGFSEKPMDAERSVNGGFFVLEKAVFEFIDGDSTAFEEEPLAQLSRRDELRAFEHTSFWFCMDTPKDYMELNALASAYPEVPWLAR